MAETAEHFEIESLIRPDCQAQIASIIEGNNGREVFFVGKVDDEGRVAEVEAYAFGTDKAVPAIIHQAQYGDVVLHNHPGSDLEPSGADISVASTLGDAGVGCYIVDNACERIRVVVRAFRPKTLEPLDAAEIGQKLGPQGILARALDDYEPRPQQARMGQAIAGAFNKDRIAIIEAGTGVGKSMAYLIPAIRWALANKQRVVVSTNTINLQEQLIRKDVPLLQKHSGWQFSSVLVKGRQNYVCLRRVHVMEGEAMQPEFEGFRNELKDLIKWALSTEDGSLADLAARPSDESWDLIKVEAETCTRARCPYYQRCFFYEARRTASRAQIIVCNHHILMADLVVRLESNNYTAAAILPPFQRLILDEAHNLEDVATNYLGLRMTRRGMLHLLARIYASPPRKRATGVLASVLRKLTTSEKQAEFPEVAQAVDFIHHTLIPLVGEVRHRVEAECSAVFEGALEYLDRPKLERNEDTTLRMVPQVEAHPFYEMTLVEACHGLTAAFGELARALGELVEMIGELRDVLKAAASWLGLEVRAYRDRALGVGTDLAHFLTSKSDVARWLELRQRTEESIVRLCTAPVAVGPGLRRTLFGRCPTVVMTSATLTVDRKFDYMLDRLGLKVEPPAAVSPAAGEADAVEVIDVGVDAETEEARSIVERVKTLGLDTPFDFERQAFVAVPLDVAEPTTPQFAADLESLILRAVEISRGRAFVLFTSYNLLQRLHGALEGRLRAMGLTPLKQGQVNRHILLNRFRNEKAPVLFATSSFWEGVDVRGEALVCLILTRLPFRVPTDPIVQARVEHIERDGRNAFMNYTVPQAVIKFKQGFGRLIRHKEDRGAVLIFDQRVATKRYGATFLRSLPTERIHTVSRDEMFDAMERFFGGGATGRDGQPIPGTP